MAATFSAAAVSAAPALASSAGRAGPAPRGLAAAPNIRASVPTEKSTSFAGYEIDSGKSGGTTVTASLTAPKVKGCTKTDKAIAPSAGMDVNSPSNYSDADLFVGCYKGKAKLFPALTINSVEKNYTTTAIHPGNKVVLTTAVTSKTTKVTFFDETTKVKKTETGSGETGGVGYPWVGDVAWDFTSGVLAPVPNFGKVKLSGAKVGGKALGSYAASDVLYRYNRYNSSETTLQIKTGPFASNQENFSTAFKHS